MADKSIIASRTVQAAAILEVLVQLNAHLPEMQEAITAISPNAYYWIASAIPVGIMFFRYITTGAVTFTLPVFKKPENTPQ